MRYLQKDGRAKVLFGTNYPMILPEKALATLDVLGLDDDARERFLTTSAQRVFRFA